MVLESRRWFWNRQIHCVRRVSELGGTCILPHCHFLILRKRKHETRFWSRIIITSNKLNSVLLNTHMAHQECAHNTSDSKLSARDSQLVRSGMSLVEGVGSKEELPRSSRTSFGAIRGCPHGEHQGPAAFQRRGEGRGGVGSKEELPRSNRTSFGAIRMESTRSSSSPEAGR